MEIKEGLQENLGKIIRQERQKKSWSHEKLAEEAGLDANNISRIERGERAPEHETLIRLVRALKLEHSNILADQVHVLEKFMPDP